MGRRTALGFLVLLVGVGYLLQLMGLLHLTAAWLTGPVLWPWLLVLVGLFGLKEVRRGRVPWGAVFFIVLGLLLSFKAAGVLPVGLQRVGGWNLFWALALIFAGLSFIVPRRRGRRWWPIFIDWNSNKPNKDFVFGQADRGGQADPAEPDWVDISDTWTQRAKRRAQRGHGRHEWREKVFGDGRPRPWRRDHRWIGDLSIGRQPWVLKNLDLWNGIGDVRVNLATAHVEDGHYDIEIRGIIGDVRVLVPENLPVLVEAEVGVGDIEVFGEKHSGTKRFVSTEDPEYTTGNRQCRIAIYLRIGDVEVVRV